MSARGGSQAVTVVLVPMATDGLALAHQKEHLHRTHHRRRRPRRQRHRHTSQRVPWNWLVGCPRQDSDSAAVASHCRYRHANDGCRRYGCCWCCFAVVDSFCRTRCSIARRRLRPRKSASGRNPCSTWTVTDGEAGREEWGWSSAPSGPSSPRPMAVAHC